MDADVSVAIVSYNTRALLARCLDALARVSALRLDVIVVDNASTDGSVEMVRRDYPAVRAVANTGNVGFAAGTNQAIAAARGRHVLLLNPDAIVSDGTVEAMAAFLDAHPRAGICGPRLILPDGRLQSCGLAFPTLTSELRASRRADRLLSLVWPRRPAPTPPHEAAETDWVEGACLMARRAMIDDIGPLDERFFLYAEELDWCRAARKAGWSVYALPTVDALHYRGQSTDQRADASLSDLVEAKLAYFRKHDGWLTALALAAIYTASEIRHLIAGRPGSRPKLRGIARWLRRPSGRRERAC